MQKIIIIVAGGKGLRMGHDIPKQFIPIGGKPVLMHTIEAFYRADPSFQTILVLPIDHQSYWKELCVEYHFDIQHHIANGGDTRFHSVKNGLHLANKIVTTQSIIGIHDGVRPFVSQELIRESFALAATAGAVIPVIDVHETIRQIADESNFTVDRAAYRLVQTPQVFRSEVIQSAYLQEFNDRFTDDASVVEAMGKQITLVSGNRENIKITTPFDILIGEAILKSR